MNPTVSHAASGLAQMVRAAFCLGSPTLVAAASVASLAAPAALAQAVTYRCQDGTRLSVQYELGEATAWARLPMNGRVLTLPFHEETTAEIIVFRQGSWRLSVDNHGPDMRRAGNLFLTRSGSAMVNGRATPVDRMVCKAGQPVRPASSLDPATGKPLAAGHTAFGEAFRAVVKGQRLSLEGPGLAGGEWPVARAATAQGLAYTARGAQPPVVLTLRSGRCVHEGQRLRLRARLSLGSRHFQGCAVEGAWGTAPT